MINRINKKNVLPLLVFLCLSCFLISIFCFVGTADSKSISDFLNEDYIEGSSVVIPENYVNNQKMDKIIYSPSGQAYVGDMVTLNESGKWKIVYKLDGQKEEYDFRVNKPMYVIDGTNSTASYGKASEFTPYKAENKSGIYSKIYSNESIKYNKVIDLKGKTKNDNLVTFTTLPETVGYADADRFIIKFTDVNDPENYVMVMIKYVGTFDWGKRTVYIMAGSSEQDGIGLEHSESGFLYEGENLTLHEGFYETPFGTNVVFSMTGRTDFSRPATNDSVGLEELSISMDYTEKRVYANGLLIADLDDPILQEYIWGGFSSDKCYISFSADIYNKVSFNMMLLELDGSNDLSANYVDNKIEPVITLSNPNPDLVGEILIDKKFKVPSAEAIDAFGNSVKVDCKVYLAYKTGTQMMIPIIDGCITPTAERDYYFVYSCLDDYGNYAEKIVVKRAVQEIVEMTFSLDNSINNAQVAEEYSIPIPEILNACGGYNVKISAITSNKTEEIISYDYNNQPKSCYYVPMSIGVLTIVYEYSDCYRTKTESFDIDVKSGSLALFDSEPVLPKYIVRDAKYVTPNFYGYSFASGVGTLKRANVYLGFDDNFQNANLIEDEHYKITDIVSKAYFYFELEGIVKSYIVDVIDVNYSTKKPDITKYFTGFVGEPILSKEIGCLYKVDGEKPLSYVKALQAYAFAFSFSIPSDSTLDSFDLYLTDTANENNFIKISLFIQNQKLYISLNDGTALQVLIDSLQESVIIRYSSSVNKITLSTNQSFSVLYNFNGEEWKGFTENKLWIDIKSNSTDVSNLLLNVERINNQLFYSANFNSIDEDPEIYQVDVSGDRKLNDIVELTKIHYDDVFAFECKATLTVYDPDGDYVTTIDNVLLDGKEDANNLYSFKLTKYGSYFVEYVVVDDLGGYYEDFSYMINVVDNIAPTITVKDYHPEAKINTAIILPQYELTDNVSNSENCKVSIFIERPDHTMFSWSNIEKDGEKNFTQEGLYRIWYFAVDENNNMAQKFITFFVSK